LLETGDLGFEFILLFFRRGALDRKKLYFTGSSSLKRNFKFFTFSEDNFNSVFKTSLASLGNSGSVYIYSIQGIKIL
jgi:hypothetical protein